jgi:hypothetical protein
MSGVYSVAPALRAFGTDFGNGDWDREFFPVDDESPRAITGKREELKRSAQLYVGRHRVPARVEQVVAEWVAKESGQAVRPLDSLMANVAEDLAIVVQDGAEDRLAYLHICSSSHWGMHEKLGQSFFATHQPVPGIERVNAAATGLVRAMITGTPKVRFVWTVETDDDFNHHPLRPAGREFGPDRPFFIRWERQITVGFPELNAAAFLIRVGFCPESAILPYADRRDSLISSLESMPPASRVYKGLTEEKFANLMKRLR